MQDMVRSRDGQELLNLIDYMFQHLQGTYGTRMLVLEYVSQILVTLNTYMKKDTRFQVRPIQQQQLPPQPHGGTPPALQLVFSAVRVGSLSF